MEVRQLGRVFLTGNTQSRELRLVRASDKALVASVVWTPAGGVNGQIKYAPLAAAVTLASNTEYYLVAKEVSGEYLYSLDTVVTTTSAATIQSAIYSTDGITFTVPSNGPGPYSYGPVGLVYCANATDEPTVEEAMLEPMIPAPADMALVAPEAIVVDGYLTLEYLRSVADLGVDYVIEASEDGTSWSSAEGLIEESVEAIDTSLEYVKARYPVPVTDSPVRFLRLRLGERSQEP